MKISCFSKPQVNFSAKKTSQKPVMTGIDYSSLDTFECKKKFKKECSEAAKEGKLTPEMIETAILDRIPKIIQKVERFCCEHPEFDKDDIIEGAILAVVEAANSYNGQNAISACFIQAENRFLEKELREQINKEKLIENVEDVSGFAYGDSEDPVLDEVYHNDLRYILQEKLDTLTPRESLILKRRTGFDDDIHRTLENIGREFNVTRDRIRQIEAKGLRKMRHPARSRCLRNYLPEYEDMIYVLKNPETDSPQSEKLYIDA